jgi:sterol desaturase/sphingolipid hydroxylase (fatty acid hydroxylase superfamily)
MLGLIVATMVAASLLEFAVPLQRHNRAHLGVNLALTGLAFAVNAACNAGLVAALWRLKDFGVVPLLRLPTAASIVVVVVALDLATYLAHVAMHKSDFLWRIHRVHHSDPTVDVTTSFRHHPVESMFRYVAIGVFAIALGAPPAAFAVYRLWSALNGVFEHANVRLPTALDSLLALLLVSPNMHKVHHSRDAAQTDTNYGNIFSFWDRLFSTFTPARRGMHIDYGLEC